MLEDEKVEKTSQILGTKQTLVRKNPIKMTTFGRRVTKTSDMINCFLKFVTIGINSTVIQNLQMDDHIFVGTGTVVVQDLFEPGTYVGIPAKLLKRK